MRRWRAAGLLALALTLAACVTKQPVAHGPPAEAPPIRDIYATSRLRDTVYLPVDRKAPAPPGYGLYSVLLTRAANANTQALLAELFKSTAIAGDAALASGNLNLVTIPVKDAADAQRALGAARTEPKAAAAALMRDAYDFGQAAKLLASLCQAAQGATARACGSRAPEGPLLVTTVDPLDGAPAPDRPLLIVNLSTTPAEAVAEVLAAYRRQILRKDFPDRAEFGWRLWALNHILDTAKLLPPISKALAAGK